MNLYLIYRTDEVGYDEYDAYVIAEKTEKKALAYARWEAIPDAPPICQKIGVAVAGTPAGIILGSFNAA